jgi:ankyrin repeat protein
VRLLINRGARLNATDNQGHSPLKWARETGSRDVFAYLKSQGGKEFDSSTTTTATTTTSQRTNKKQRLSTKSTSPPTTATSIQVDNSNDKITF